MRPSISWENRATAGADSRWDTFVAEAGNACFLHSGQFLSYHRGRFDERTVFACDENGRPVGGMRFVADGALAHSHPGSTFGGVLLREGLRGADALATMLATMDALRSWGFSRLRVRPMPPLLRTSPDESDLYALHRARAEVVRRELSTIIRLGERLNLSKGRKSQISRARRAGLHVEESRDPRPFHRVLTDALAQHNTTPVHDTEQLEMLMRRLPEKIRLFVTKRDTDETLAGALVFDFGSTVHTQYLAADVEGRSLGALDLVIHHLATEAFVDRRLLSFGISTEAGGEILNEGLLAYKESFGGFSHVIDTYEIAL